MSFLRGAWRRLKCRTCSARWLVVEQFCLTWMPVKWIRSMPNLPISVESDGTITSTMPASTSKISVTNSGQCSFLWALKYNNMLWKCCNITVKKWSSEVAETRESYLTQLIFHMSTTTFKCRQEKPTRSSVSTLETSAATTPRRMPGSQGRENFLCLKAT